MSKLIGKVHKPGTMFLRVHVGKATGGDGSEYEMSLNAGESSPIVCNTKTGLYYTLSWTDILNLAKAAGIDKKAVKP